MPPRALVILTSSRRFWAPDNLTRTIILLQGAMILLVAQRMKDEKDVLFDQPPNFSG